ncbi:hypothetical protein LTS08_006018 [Lithohypha guttulata]|uniref:uncharacterized protein n=1 Tax=Lithohypha guttulata TaxID=1690604 RepID=UPI002DE178BD|nr:hypothetical protein LTR51_002532 [Lithohypha guttulata]KAK5099436.1 hypothetical protein LTS08_006018 [Lithohypha guttulata]
MHFLTTTALKAVTLVSTLLAGIIIGQQAESAGLVLYTPPSSFKILYDTYIQPVFATETWTNLLPAPAVNVSLVQQPPTPPHISEDNRSVLVSVFVGTNGKCPAPITKDLVVYEPPMNGPSWEEIMEALSRIRNLSTQSVLTGVILLYTLYCVPVLLVLCGIIPLLKLYWRSEEEKSIYLQALQASQTQVRNLLKDNKVKTWALLRGLRGLHQSNAWHRQTEHELEDELEDAREDVISLTAQLQEAERQLREQNSSSQALVLSRNPRPGMRRLLELTNGPATEGDEHRAAPSATSDTDNTHLPNAVRPAAVGDNDYGVEPDTEIFAADEDDDDEGINIITKRDEDDEQATPTPPLPADNPDTQDSASVPDGDLLLPVLANIDPRDELVSEAISSLIKDTHITISDDDLSVYPILDPQYVKKVLEDAVNEKFGAEETTESPSEEVVYETAVATSLPDFTEDESEATSSPPEPRSADEPAVAEELVSCEGASPEEPAQAESASSVVSTPQSDDQNLQSEDASSPSTAADAKDSNNEDATAVESDQVQKSAPVMPVQPVAAITTGSFNFNANPALDSNVSTEAVDKQKEAADRQMEAVLFKLTHRTPKAITKKRSACVQMTRPISSSNKRAPAVKASANVFNFAEPPPQASQPTPLSQAELPSANPFSSLAPAKPLQFSFGPTAPFKFPKPEERPREPSQIATGLLLSKESEQEKGKADIPTEAKENANDAKAEVTVSTPKHTPSTPSPTSSRASPPPSNIPSLEQRQKWQSESRCIKCGENTHITSMCGLIAREPKGTRGGNTRSKTKDRRED